MCMLKKIYTVYIIYLAGMKCCKKARHNNVTVSKWFEPWALMSDRPGLELLKLGLLLVTLIDILTT